MTNGSTIVLPRLRGLTPADHQTLVSSFQTIKPAIDSAIAAAKSGTATAQQVFSLTQQLASLQAQITAIQAEIAALESGTTAPGNIFEYTMAPPFGGFPIAVYESSAGAVSIADASTNTQPVIGMAIGIGSSAGKAKVALYGEVSSVSWAWTPMDPVYLSTAGALTQTIPGMPYTIVGWAVSPTTIYVWPLRVNEADTQISGLAAATITIGQPIYADRTTGQFKLAAATTQATSTCIGLATAGFASGFTATVNTQIHQQDDWTAVTGTALLSKGQVYFLSSTPGMLTTTAPTSGFVAPIGVAATTTTFNLAVQPTIQL